MTVIVADEDEEDHDCKSCPNHKACQIAKLFMSDVYWTPHGVIEDLEKRYRSGMYGFARLANYDHYYSEYPNVVIE